MEGNNMNEPRERNWAVVGEPFFIYIWRVRYIKGSIGNKHPFLMLFLLC